MLDFTKVEEGQTLNFSKDFGAPVTGKVSFNLNWGKIRGKAVDLDAYCIIKGDTGVIKTISFANTLHTGIKHHGDDLTGAWAKGEYIEVDLDKLPHDVTELVFGASSYSGDKFNDLPFAHIKVFTGAPGASAGFFKSLFGGKTESRGLVNYELKKFDDNVMSAALAHLKKNAAGEWEITAIKATSTRRNAVTELARNL